MAPVTSVTADPAKAGEEIVRSVYTYILSRSGGGRMTEDEASAKIAAGMRGLSTRRNIKKKGHHHYVDPEREAKIRARKERISMGQASAEDKMKDKEFQRALKSGMTDDEAAAKIAAGMKGLHTRKQLKNGNSERYTDTDRSQKIKNKKKKKKKKKQMTDDEASAKIAAGMKGLHTRKQLKAGNTGNFEDKDRAEKVAARKERIAKNQATEEDKAKDKEFQRAKKAGMTDDEAAAKIAAGMKGLHTRKQLKAGNTGRFQDSDRGDKIAARKAKKAEAEAK